MTPGKPRKAETGLTRALRSAFVPGRRSAAREYAEVAVVIAVVTEAGRVLPLSYHALGHIYLLAVVALSLRVGRGPVFFAAFASAVAWDFFFVSPTMSFAILDFDDAILLGVYLGVALIAGQLTTYLRKHEKLAAEAGLQRALLDSVSHELKTPLSILRSASEQLDGRDPARVAALAQEIGEATRRLDHLVANLLNQTRLESGALRPRMEWCDARDIINSARRAVERSLAGRPFKAEIPADMPLFMADARLMEQATANLLLNAALHTPAGSPVHVSAGVDEPCSRVFISVSDRGPGLPPGAGRMLFQKFRRGENAAPGGLGLGLSIVRGFLVAQGGEVVALDNPGGGALFSLYLPLARPEGIPSE